ncbi:MAG: zinc ribbon domain-containing protein [Eubacteriales bacterium]|nr:zinc ribbon domain-containing protein [Eubacteriales bacterium]
MTNDLFGGLMKGLGSFMPKDDPNVKLFQTQSEISELKNRELQLYAEIGKKAYPELKDQAVYADLVTELNFIQKKLSTVQEDLQAARNIKSEQEQQEQEQLKARTCPNCDTLNPEGVKFCQECGAKLNLSTKVKCLECGAVFPIGTRFCGECGRQL